MATTYTSYPPDPPLTLVGVNEVVSSFNIATGTTGGVGFVINDIVQMVQVPPGALVTSIKFDFPILDTNVSPAAVIDIGTNMTTANGGLNINGFIAASTAGTNFSTIPNVLSDGAAAYVHASLPFYYEPVLFGPGGGVQQQWCPIAFKIHTAPATTATTGTVWCTVRYTFNGDAGQFSLKNL